MKKYLVVVGLALILASVALASDLPPPPFDKVKEYAQMGTMNKYGERSLGYERTINGEVVELFKMAYSSVNESVCIGGGTRENFEIFCWSPEIGYCQYIGYGMIIRMEEKETAEKVYQMFRRMVELGLL